MSSPSYWDLNFSSQRPTPISARPSLPGSSTFSSSHRQPPPSLDGAAWAQAVQTAADEKARENLAARYSDEKQKTAVSARTEARAFLNAWQATDEEAAALKAGKSLPTQAARKKRRNHEPSDLSMREFTTAPVEEKPRPRVLLSPGEKNRLLRSLHNPQVLRAISRAKQMAGQPNPNKETQQEAQHSDSPDDDHSPQRSDIPLNNANIENVEIPRAAAERLSDLEEFEEPYNQPESPQEEIPETFEIPEAEESLEPFSQLLEGSGDSSTPAPFQAFQDDFPPSPSHDDLLAAGSSELKRLKQEENRLEERSRALRLAHADFLDSELSCQQAENSRQRREKREKRREIIQEKKKQEPTEKKEKIKIKAKIPSVAATPIKRENLKTPKQPMERENPEDSIIQQRAVAFHAFSLLNSAFAQWRHRVSLIRLEAAQRAAQARHRADSFRKASMSLKFFRFWSRAFQVSQESKLFAAARERRAQKLSQLLKNSGPLKEAEIPQPSSASSSNDPPLSHTAKALKSALKNTAPLAGESLKKSVKISEFSSAGDLAEQKNNEILGQTKILQARAFLSPYDYLAQPAATAPLEAREKTAKPEKREKADLPRLFLSPRSRSQLSLEESQAAAEEIARREKNRKERRDVLAKAFQEKQQAAKEARLRAKQEKQRQEEENARLEAAQSQANLFDLRKAAELAKRLSEEKTKLAALHYSRSLILHRGWLPWRAFVASRQRRLSEVRIFRAFKIVQGAFAQWRENARRQKERKKQKEEKNDKKAVLHRRRRLAKRIFRSWRIFVVSIAEKVLVFESFQRRALSRGIFRAWRAAALARQQAKLEKFNQIGQRSAQKYYFTLWRHFVASQRSQRLVAAREKETWLKVNGWLEEIRKEKLGKSGEFKFQPK